MFEVSKGKRERKRVSFSLSCQEVGNLKKKKTSHHHPDVLLHLVVDGAVEHDVHELVEAAERARDGAVGIQRDCVFLNGVFF